MTTCSSLLFYCKRLKPILFFQFGKLVVNLTQSVKIDIILNFLFLLRITQQE